jgi:hypothetical protein
MTYNEQVKAIIDEVRPHFELLGMYAFQGEGEPEKVTNAFVKVAGAYTRAKELTQETFGSAYLEVADGSMWCGDGGVVGDDDEELINAYEFASGAGFLPPPLFVKIDQFTMQMNRYFIAAQQKGRE